MCLHYSCYWRQSSRQTSDDGDGDGGDGGNNDGDHHRNGGDYNLVVLIVLTLLSLIQGANHATLVRHWPSSL